MKRQILLTALLVCTAACTTANAPANNSTANTNTNANLSATPAAAAADTCNEQELLARDRQVWDAIRAKNFDAFATFLADDLLEVSNEGVSTKAESVKGIQGLELTDLSFSDTRVVKIDADAAVVTHTINQKGSYQGQPFGEQFQTVRASTGWVRRNGQWLVIYHQESFVRKEANTSANSNRPAASPSPTAAATTATTTGSPAASPLTTSADVVANERQIWDAFKARNFDGFASVLAEDSIEVEPSGVYNKQASLDALRHELDLGKAELSDFRQVKFDDDASLVTYMVSLPGGGGRPPMKMRHSTIWANRGGRWMAVFHQGTDVVEMQRR